MKCVFLSRTLKTRSKGQQNSGGLKVLKIRLTFTVYINQPAYRQINQSVRSRNQSVCSHINQSVYSLTLKHLVIILLRNKPKNFLVHFTLFYQRRNLFSIEFGIAGLLRMTTQE